MENASAIAGKGGAIGMGGLGMKAGSQVAIFVDGNCGRQDVILIGLRIHPELVLVWLYRSRAGAYTATGFAKRRAKHVQAKDFERTCCESRCCTVRGAIESMLRQKWTIPGLREYHPAGFPKCAGWRRNVAHSEILHIRRRQE